MTLFGAIVIVLVAYLLGYMTGGIRGLYLSCKMHTKARVPGSKHNDCTECMTTFKDTP